MHQEADTTDDKEHDGTERINLKAHVSRKGTGKDPGVEFGLDGFTRVHDEAENDDQRTHQGTTNRTYTQEVGFIANHTSPQKTIEEHSQGWKDRNQPDQNVHSTCASLVTDHS